jgi:hypothetical protein
MGVEQFIEEQLLHKSFYSFVVFDLGNMLKNCQRWASLIESLTPLIVSQKAYKFTFKKQRLKKYFKTYML